MDTIFNWLVQGFSWILNILYPLVNNYGVAIVLLSVFIKLILLPFSISQYKSSLATQSMAPLTKKINDHYAAVEDPVERRNKIGAATQKLYKAAGIKPAAGCLILLIQLPIMIALYFVITHPLTTLLGMSAEALDAIRTQLSLPYTTPELNLIWQITARGGITDPGGVEWVRSLISMYPEVADFVNYQLLNFNFFGMNLLSTPQLQVLSPVLVLPFASGFFGWLSSYQLMTRKTKEEKRAEKEAVKKAIAEGKEPDVDYASQSQGTMLLMMPIMNVFISFQFPAGVGLYWALSSGLQALQQWIMRKFFFKDFALSLPELELDDVIKPKKKLDTKKYKVKKKKK